MSDNDQMDGLNSAATTPDEEFIESTASTDFEDEDSEDLTDISSASSEDKRGVLARGFAAVRSHSSLQVADEVKDQLESLFKGMSIDQIKNGDWFVNLVTLALSDYDKKVDAAYIRDKYPNLPPDTIADKRIELAVKATTLSGFMWASAQSGVVAVTLGTGGAASPATVPAAVVTFLSDMACVSIVQMRLAYDLSVIYGKPYDLEDPDDLMRLVYAGFGIKARELARNAVSKSAPAVTRFGIKKVFSGSTLKTVQTLPMVGKHLLQRNLIKGAIPIINIPLSTGMNYFSTKSIGKQIKRHHRRRALIEETTRRAVSESGDAALIMNALWYVLGESSTTDNERDIIHYTAQALEEAGHAPESLGVLRETVRVDEDELALRAADLEDGQQSIMQLVLSAVLVNGKVDKKRRTRAQNMAQMLGIELDPDLLELQLKRWR